MKGQYQHWKVKQEHGIFWLGFDRKDASVNTISTDVLDELNDILHAVNDSDDKKGLILYAAKKKGFIAGADVHQFSKFTKAEEISDMLQKGQSVFTKLEQLPIPTVALIDGFCMGGGTELVLACDYRIASDDDHTKIGLPEVMLGFHPGWGGTVRLPALIGGFKALANMMLSGAAISAKRAKALGVVDAVVPVRQLQRAGLYYINKKPAKHKPGFLDNLSNQPVVRSLVAKLLRSQLKKKVRPEHYPAPFAMVDLWEKYWSPSERAYRKELDSVVSLVHNSETAKNLIRVFGLRERLKSFAKEGKGEFKHVHVIGAGVMGGDIAAWCALKGLNVTLQDMSFERIAPAIGRASALYEKKLKQPRKVQAALDRLTPDPQGYGVAKADVIIEAVFENLEVKQKIFKDLETRAKKDAILATNTSSIPLDDISSTMSEPKRLVGIHYFNPVARMDLVEVVSSDVTSKTVAAKACEFVGAIGKLPLPVRSSPGFLVNRVLMPYLMECMTLLQEGVSGASIDEAAQKFGMMMGPVEMADTVGLDVCLAVAENLTAAYGGTVPEMLKTYVNEGRLGRKTGRGFYEYTKGKPVKVKDDKTTMSSEDIANRLIMRLISESKACLRKAVVSDADLVDAGMIFASGFAPFRGGPLHYADLLGNKGLKSLAKELSERFGDRFALVLE